MNHRTKAKTKYKLLALFLTTGLSMSFSAIAQNDEYKSISVQELIAITKKMPPIQQGQFVENEGLRRDLIKNVKDAFSLAQAAQAEGLDKTEKFKKNLETQTDQLLAQIEITKSAQGENAKPAEVLEAEITAYATAHTAEFNALIKVMSGDEKVQPTKAQLDGMKKNWAEIKIRADRARKAGMEKDPDVQLQLKLQRAQLLAGAYQQSLKDKTKPTPEELQEYYQTHPDADPEKIKQQAEDILRRIRSGADFAAMAMQYSSDGSAVNGGLLRWFGRGRMVREFEEAAFGLPIGQVSDLVKTQFGYHIIRVEGREFAKPIKGTDDVTNNNRQVLILARHILISTNAATEAEGKIQQKKMKSFVEEAVLKYPVSAPYDFPIQVPPADPQQNPATPSSVATSQDSVTKSKPIRKAVKKH